MVYWVQLLAVWAESPPGLRTQTPLRMRSTLVSLSMSPLAMLSLLVAPAGLPLITQAPFGPAGDEACGRRRDSSLVPGVAGYPGHDRSQCGFF